MMQQSSHVSLPPLPPFSLSTAPIRSMAAPTISDCSSGLSDLSAAAAAVSAIPFPHYQTEPPPFIEDNVPVCALSDLPYPLQGQDGLGPISLSDRPGYIRILPRTSAAAGMYKKRCETCSRSHDGSFGAGRFCSSRCARTVGGLAHRKKRMLERGAKARNAADNRLKLKKGRVAKYSLDGEVSKHAPTFSPKKPNLDAAMSSPKGVAACQVWSNSCSITSSANLASDGQILRRSAVAP